MVPLVFIATVTGIFAGKHLRTLTVIAVVAQTMREEPLLIAIVVLVIEIYLQLLHAGLQQVEVPALGVRTCGADEFQIGILGAKGGIELFQTLREHRAIPTVLLVVVPLLVTYSKELQVEGLGMTHVGTYLTPFRVDRTIGKLHQVESILNIAVEIVECYVYTGLRWIRVLELTAQSAADDGQRLTAEVLAELEKLEETQSVALVIVGEETVAEGVVPAVLVQRTVLDRSHAVLPLVAGLQLGTFHDTTARETEYTGVHVKERLGEVLAHTVLTAFPCVGREE